MCAGTAAALQLQMYVFSPWPPKFLSLSFFLSFLSLLHCTFFNYEIPERNISGWTTFIYCIQHRFIERACLALSINSGECFWHPPTLCFSICISICAHSKVRGNADAITEFQELEMVELIKLPAMTTNYGSINNNLTLSLWRKFQKGTLITVMLLT